MDTFGDGFNTGYFFIFDSQELFEKHTPTCNKNPVLVEYCFNPNTMKDGDSVTATASGVSPSHKWEV